MNISLLAQDRNLWRRYLFCTVANRRVVSSGEHARLKQALREREAIYETILQAANVGAWELDLASGDIASSQSMAAVHGLAPEACPKHVADYVRLVHPDDRPQIEASLERAQSLAGGVAFDEQFRILTPDGSVRWMEVKGQLVEPGLARGVVIDVTSRKEMEQHLERAQKLEAVGRLAGGMAHDFTNVLSAIIGYTELMLLQLSDADPIRADVREIQTAADRAARLTRQLLGFGRHDPPQLRVHNVNVLIARLATLLTKSTGDDVELRIRLDPALDLVRIDPGQFEQVLMNLVINARDAMPKGGQLTITTSRLAREDGVVSVVVSVQDTGTGMDAQMQAQIFEPFFTTKGDKGSGLGLPTALRLIRENDGDLRLTSEPGRGTTFELHLPAAILSQEEQASWQAPRPAPPSIESVLVVDDDEGIRKLLVRLLAQQGFQVTEAATAARALALLAEPGSSPAHLLITDVVMPQGSGLELADNVGAIAPGTRVIFMTAPGSLAASQVRQRPGAILLEKPFTTVRVRAAIKTAQQVQR